MPDDKPRSAKGVFHSCGRMHDGTFDVELSAVCGEEFGANGGDDGSHGEDMVDGDEES